jgi:hypothetical protein
VTLDEATAQHQLLKSVVGEQYRHADPGPVEGFALRAVFRLLCEHRPDIDEQHSTALMCKTCWDTWPCDVYQAIEMESHHGG